MTNNIDIHAPRAIATATRKLGWTVYRIDENGGKRGLAHDCETWQDVREVLERIHNRGYSAQLERRFITVYRAIAR